MDAVEKRLDDALAGRADPPGPDGLFETGRTAIDEAVGEIRTAVANGTAPAPHEVATGMIEARSKAHAPVDRSPGRAAADVGKGQPATASPLSQLASGIGNVKEVKPTSSSTPPAPNVGSPPGRATSSQQKAPASGLKMAKGMKRR